VAACAAAAGGSIVLVEEASRASTSPRSTAASRDPADTSIETFALIVTEGESPGWRIAIGPAPIVIGRGMGVDLQIRDATVSRHHCVVWSIAGRCWVRDLGSKNQTRVNNRWSLVTEIFAGDVLVVGQTAIRLTRACAGESGPSHR
jgi:pSer/pThr/pTyr-binding forkhead associated (FHA) protein